MIESTNTLAQGIDKAPKRRIYSGQLAQMSGQYAHMGKSDCNSP